MKRIDDLTRDELVALTDEEIERYVDIECAEEGVELLPPAPVEPGTLEAKPDTTVYCLGSFVFKNEEEAETVLELLRECSLIETYYLDGSYSYSGPEGVKPREEDPEIIRRKYWSNELYTEHRAAIKHRGEERERFNKERERYNRILKEREKSAEYVYEKVRQAHDDARTDEEIKYQFAEYSDLTEGNRVLALKCILKAHPHYEEEHVRSLVGMPAKDAPMEMEAHL